MKYNLNADKCVREILTEIHKLVKSGETASHIELHPYWYYFLITKKNVSFGTSIGGYKTLYGLNLVENEDIETFKISTKS